MNCLGIDHGEVRIGLAVSDALGCLAHPLETIRTADAFERIPELVRQRGIDIIVLGYPLRIDGSEGQAARRVRRFLEGLRPQLPDGIRIILQDESHSTQQAAENLRRAGRKTRRHRPVIDQAAAVVILQEYLDELGGASSATLPPPME
jgi:putative Holliday junction resolvase